MVNYFTPKDCELIYVNGAEIYMEIVATVEGVRMTLKTVTKDLL